ncbi:hypothetical protein [Succinivibrio dextrinosolvens]|uniref:Uncharacterized membrane protein n=1 Tax=Succinivibrio dextrinosolvens DSM 3072 TaxID=1123324 RepID=A0A1T4VJ33_9GAMM|nr:hypothetical protein [Succinivibrio dextrinosolvens]SKA64923.1 Uncharacterized membrane protein [Succinivibrio dextrinosolvens DSM 3072]
MATKSGIRTQTEGTKRQTELVAQDDNNPLPPIEQLEKLHNFRPDLVDKVVEQSFKEAEHRRALDKEQFDFFKSTTNFNKWLVAVICILCIGVTLVLGLEGKQMSALGSCFFPVILLLTRLFRR